jgi:hypothetical protein
MERGAGELGGAGWVLQGTFQVVVGNGGGGGDVLRGS